MKLHYFQHVPFEGLGSIAAWAEKRGHALTKTAFYESPAALPDMAGYDALIIMGGPMGVYDEDAYPWLADEKKHIWRAIDAGKPVLGICLGAQLIAAALGAEVAPHCCKEIGWFPVAVADEAAGHPILAGLNDAMMVFHWHGDRFEIPEGALHLMRSAACDHQAFLYGERVFGLQFHLEMDKAAIESLVHGCGHELTEEEYVQSAEVIREKAESVCMDGVLYRLLDNWVG